MASPDLPSSLAKHLKLANIEGIGINEKLQERRLVQIVSYLELVALKLTHKQIHTDSFRRRIQDNIAMANHSDLLDRIAEKLT